MWKRKKFIIPMVAAITLAGVLAGGAFAQEDENSPSPGNTFIERLSDKLGIQQDELEQALTEVMSEMREDAMNNHLERLVAEGRLSEEEAEQFLEWWQDRPDIVLGGFGAKFGGCGGKFGAMSGPCGSLGPGVPGNCGGFCGMN